MRWGILSTARINRRIIPAIRLARRCQLAAVASRDRGKAEAYAAEWSIPRAVVGYQTLLDSSDIDAVYISLPNTEHVPWTLAAIAAGKHVLCEKPLALDPLDVDRIATAAGAAGVAVEEAFMYRHEPLTARVQALLRDGAIGEVRAIVSGFTFAIESGPNIRLSSGLGGGSLWDIGCYPVSYAQLIAGKEATVVAGHALWHPAGVDEEFMGLLRFDGRLTANIYSGFRAAFRTWLEILGTDAALTVPNPFRPSRVETLEIERNGVMEPIAVEGSDALWVRMLENFTARVLDHAPPVVTLAESRRTAATLAALHSAAREDKRVVYTQ